MSAIEVSVVIPCYNYARFLPDAVASVIAQTFSKWEIIIVDDGSSDDTLGTAQRLMAQHSDHPIRLFHQPKGGPGAARNTGARQAAGAYLLFLDADDMLAPTYLERTAAVLCAQRSVGFVYSGMRLFGHDQHEWPSVPFTLRDLLLEDYVLSHALVRRVAWEQVGGFDTLRFPHGFEDWDFWLLVAAAGWRGWHIAAPLVLYRRHGNSLSDRVSREHAWDARAQIIRKHPDLYGRRLAAWANVRCARRSLPMQAQPVDAEPEEVLPDAGAVPAVAPAPPVTDECPSVPLARRLIRFAPFKLRFRVKCWRRRVQLGLRAAVPWLYLAGR